MRPGNWTDRDVREFSCVARFNGGPPVPVTSMRLTHSMIDGHPSSRDGGMSTSGTITVTKANDATSLTPEPWGRTGDWPPRSGTPVTIDITDGEGQSWRRLTGVTERAQGSFSSTTVTIPVRDRVDRLGAIVNSEPVLSTHTPLNDGGEYRRPSMSAEWLLDKACRASGFFATPEMRWEAIVSFTGVGSAWPERGTLVACTNTAGTNAPGWAWTSDYIALNDVDAIWDATSSTSVPELSMALISQASGTSMRVLVTSAGGVGAYMLTDSGGSIRFGTVAGGTYTEHGTLARGTATRAAMRVTTTSGGTVGLTVRTNTGATTTASVSGGSTFASLAFSRVRAYGNGRLGWVQLLANPGTQWMLLDPVQAATNARHRIGGLEAWIAAPQVWDEHAIDLISAWARATCGHAWIDMDGNLQLAGRDSLGTTSDSVLTLTSHDSLLDLEWEDDGMNVARQVRVTYQHPKVQLSKWASRRVWQGREQTLSAGEVDVTTVEIPDNEDWIDLDDTPYQVTAGITRQLIQRNTVIGGMQIGSDDAETATPAHFVNTSMVPDGPRAWEVTIEPWSTLDPSQSIVTVIPDGLTTIPRRYRGLPLPDVKARARVYRLERTILLDTNPGTGATIQLYEHDAGWWVQNQSRRTLLHTWLKFAMGEQQPAPTAIHVAPDLRAELGDIVTVDDKARTGVRVVTLLTEIEESIDDGGLSMTVAGRELGWALLPVNTPTDTGHQPSWDMEAS